MKSILATICFAATCLLCSAQTEAPRAETAIVKEPTLLGIKTGATKTELLAVLAEKAPGKDKDTTGGQLQKMKVDNEKTLAEITSPAIEEKYLFNHIQYALDHTSYVFPSGTVKMLELPVQTIRTQASFDPTAKDFRIDTISLTLGIPKDASSVKTMEAVKEALVSQFGQPAIDNQNGAQWPKLGTTGNKLTLLRNDNNLDISLENRGILQKTQENREKRLAEIEAAKQAPPVGGKLE